jgi:hypothetical protein
VPGRRWVVEKHARGKYIGRAKRKAPGEQPTFENAIRDAYERAMASKPEDERNTSEGPLTFRFKIVGVRVEGNNPITDYIVDLDDD